MFKRLLGSIRGGRPRDGKGPSAGSDRLPAGTRVYAVGDIHGRVDLLKRIRDMISADLEASGPEVAEIVFLGDYVDRGPASAAVVEYLIRETFPAPLVTLCGNHEAMLLEFLDRPEAGELWRKFGGIETVHSYGVDVGEFRTGQNLQATSSRMRDAIPDHHARFLQGLPLTHRVGDYFFCHAGVRPGVDLDKQVEGDLLWIRDEFISSQADFGAVVVHGHTPAERPTVRPNGIGIDTGAYITGRLTCAVLAQNEVSFLST